VSAFNALLYLYGTTLRNSLGQRVKRLRQPKYLAGAIVGGAYFYFFLFRPMFNQGGYRAPSLPAPADVAALYVPLAALALFVALALGWLIPSRRAALQFTEATVAFLFPAPVTRRLLIQAQLLRSQAAIFFTSFVLTLLFRRGAATGGNALTHALGWWVILSTLNLHLLGASFVREWMLDLGLNPARRRLVIGGILAALVAACWFIVRRTVPAPTVADAASLAGMARYAGGVLTQPPLGWVLAPFALVVKPYFAPDAGAFLAAFAPALLLLVAHYFWVVRTNVSFEEASLALAAKRAERLAARRDGRWRSGRELPTKPRPEPFALVARGWAPLAWLWKNLIALGPWARLRTWLIACATAVAGILWLGADPARLPALKIIGAISLVASIWLALFMPMLLRREMQQTLGQLDLIKAYPLAGWQVVLGDILTPVLLMVFAEWWLLLVATLSLGATTANAVMSVVLGAAGAGGIALVLPSLCGLMLCIPYAGMLYFPAWAQPVGRQSGGSVEIMGQRLIFMLGYLVVLGIAVLPAAGVGALVFFITHVFAGQAAAIVLSALLIAAVLGAELFGAVYWLGLKLESFDLANEPTR
jgi:hypothetical protein